MTPEILALFIWALAFSLATFLLNAVAMVLAIVIQIERDDGRVK